MKNLAWRHRAACRGVDPDIFYPVTEEDAEEAKAISRRMFELQRIAPIFKRIPTCVFVL